MENQQFEHRAQTNECVVVGVVSKAAQLRLAVDQKTGEVKALNEKTGGPLEIASFQIRVENGDQAIFLDVEAAAEIAYMALQLKKRETVMLTGRLIKTDRPVEKGGETIWYTDYKIRLQDRRVKFDGTANPEAPAPITRVESNTRHQCSITYFGTVGKNGVTVRPTSSGKIRTYFAAANNGGSKAKPHVSWFDNVAYDDVARDSITLVKGTLVKVTGKLNAFKPEGQRVRFEIVVKALTAVPKKDAAPAASTNPNQTADEVLQALEAAGGGAPIDPDDTHVTEIFGDGEHDSADTAELEAAGATAGTARRRRRAA